MFDHRSSTHIRISLGRHDWQPLQVYQADPSPYARTPEATVSFGPIGNHPKTQRDLQKELKQLLARRPQDYWMSLSGEQWCIDCGQLREAVSEIKDNPNFDWLRGKIVISPEYVNQDTVEDGEMEYDRSLRVELSPETLEAHVLKASPPIDTSDSPVRVQKDALIVDDASVAQMPTIPRGCTSAVNAIVAYLRDELAFAGVDRDGLRAAVQHFDTATERARTATVPIALHDDQMVNGWLLHGARSLLAKGKKTHRERLRQVAGLLAQAGAKELLGVGGTAFARVRPLGSGSYGTVWLALRLNDATPLAVKQCHAQGGNLPDESIKDALFKEAMCLMRLSHPAIPRFVACDFGRSDPYVAMQFIEGQRLGEWLLTNPSMEDREWILRTILDALEHAHSLGIHHRDMKTDNILIAPGPRPFLIDWGVAKTLLPEQQTAAPEFNANIRNSAPEWIRHMRERHLTPFEYGAVQDMWSFGAIAYHVLSGNHPFEVPRSALETAESILHTEPRPLPREYKHWTSLIAALLQKDPAKRLASCDEIIKMLDRVDEIDAEGIVESLLDGLGIKMMDSDGVLSSAMAETNATGFGVDASYVNAAWYDPIEEVVYFEAELHIAGDQDEDRMWNGDAFTLQVHGHAAQHVKNNIVRWKVDEYQVDECKSNVGSAD